MSSEIKVFLNELGWKDIDTKLMEQALTHSSHRYEFGGEDNERLEFLGDAVLSLFIVDYLFSHYPLLKEGRLAKIKSFVVSEISLASIAKKLGLPPLLRLGKGEESTGGREKDSVLADTFEAIIACVFLSVGYTKTVEILLPYFLPQIEQSVTAPEKNNYKSQLQEYLQKKHQMGPYYKVASQTGPDHEKNFVVEVWLGSLLLGKGEGKSKKHASQNAAQVALSHLKGL